MLNQNLVTARTDYPLLPYEKERATAAHAPYGLPVLDNCASTALSANDLSAALSKSSLEGLDRMKHTTTYPEGALIFVEGQTARGVYVLCRGRVKLMATNNEGKTFILKIAEAGEILGLHSAVMSVPHELSAETLEPCQLAFIAREDFLRFLKVHGDVCLYVTRQLSNDCESAYEVIRSIGLSQSVAEKLARLLLQWCSGAQATNGIICMKLALTHEEIAQLIGTSRETVTRTLGQFKNRRILEVRGSSLVILNKSALEQLC